MYRAGLIYDPDGEFIGFIPFKVVNDNIKTDGTNVYTAMERDSFQNRLDQLNKAAATTAAWPYPTDPEVMELTQNPQWEPAPYIQDEVIDEDRSHVVWISDGVNAGTIDKDQSVLHYKTVMVPSPVGLAARVKKAQQIVAERRANA